MLRGLFDAPERRNLLGAGSLIFLSIGALQAMYGPAFPAFLARYDVGIGAVGGVVGAHFLGSFVTIAASGVLLARFGYRPVLLAGTLALAAGASGVALSPAWGWTLASALLGGLGFGLLDVSTNLLFARGFGARSASALNLLNALFGLGAVLGPLLVGLLAPSLLLPFAIAAAVTLMAGVLVLGLRVPPPLETPAGLRGAPWAPLIGFVVLYFVYVACEVGVSSWEPTYLAPALGEARAAFFTSVYWASLTVGRFVAAAIGSSVRPRDLVLGASVLALAAASVAGIDGWAPVAYGLVGFAFAPIFPTALAWLAEVFPRRSEQVAPLVIAVANLGPVLGAPAIGWVVARTGPAYIPAVLAVLVGALAVSAASLWLRTGGRSGGPAPGAG